MTWEEWLGVLERAAERWGPNTGTVDEASAQRWFDEDLRELPADLVERAVKSFHRDGEKFLPHGGAIAKRADELARSEPRRPLVTVAHTEQAAAAWAAALPAIREVLGEGPFTYWIEPVKPVAIEEHVLYVEAPAETAEWIRRRFREVLSTAVISAAQGIVRVEVLRGERREAA